MKQNKNSKIQLPAKRPESQVATKSNSPIVKSNINSENPLNIAEKLQHFKNRDEVRSLPLIRHILPVNFLVPFPQ